MTADHTRRLVERFYTVMWNTWDEAVARAILDPEIEFRGSVGLTKHGHDGFLEYMNLIRTAFPDFHNRIDELVAEADRAAARLTYTGTHHGTLFDRPPTGRRVEYVGAAFFQVSGGRIQRVWVLGDLHALMQQIKA